MKRQLGRGGPFLAAILAASLAAGACVGSSASPSAGPATPTPMVTDTPTATPEITLAPAPTATPEITPTPTPTATPVPTPAPGANCVGSQTVREWFATQATHFTWTVYCASALPSGWGVDPINGAKAGYSGNGHMEVWYAGPSGKVMWIREGDFCSSGCSLSPNSGLIGPAKIGDMDGKLYWEEALLVILVNPGTNHAYTLYSEDVSQSAFVDYASHFVRVPRP